MKLQNFGASYRKLRRRRRRSYNRRHLLVVARGEPQVSVRGLLEQDPAATEEAANFGGKREVLAEKGQGRATTA